MPKFYNPERDKFTYGDKRARNFLYKSLFRLFSFAENTNFSWNFFWHWWISNLFMKLPQTLSISMHCIRFIDSNLAYIHHFQGKNSFIFNNYAYYKSFRFIEWMFVKAIKFIVFTMHRKWYVGKIWMNSWTHRFISKNFTFYE